MKKKKRCITICLEQNPIKFQNQSALNVRQSKTLAILHQLFSNENVWRVVGDVKMCTTQNFNSFFFF